MRRRRVVSRWLSSAILLVGVAAAPCPAAADAPLAASADTVALVAKVIPTVVNVTAHRATAKEASADQAASFPHLHEAVGSGFIVDPSGYIATNRHVVDGAYEIAVTFADGRTVRARQIFRSTTCDVAFLKVDLDKPLPAATLASDENLQIGQRVFAVGNPLGLGTSVSAGIVSALNRNIKQSPYDDFIQTDAAINHGSSGGPLFNEAGEVVGINTALYTSVDNGGSQGLGFAIPGRDIAFLIDQLKRYKRIRVGWLGANTQQLTPQMAEALNYPGVYGAIVAAVTRRSPAATAGLRPGDVVQSFDGRTIVDTTTLERGAAQSLGKTVTLGVWRDGTAFSTPVTITEAEKSHGALMPDGGEIAGPRFASASDLGLDLSTVDADNREQFGLPSNAEGLLVRRVADGSAAEEAGLRPGDLILTAQMSLVATLSDFEGIITEQAQKGRHRLIVLVQASGGQRWVALPLRF